MSTAEYEFNLANNVGGDELVAAVLWLPSLTRQGHGEGTAAAGEGAQGGAVAVHLGQRGLGFQRGVLAFGIHAHTHDDGAATLQVGHHTTLCLGGHGDGEVSITLVDPSQRAPLVLVSYPNPFRQSVRIKVQGGQLKEHNGTVTAILTDLTGRHEEVCLTPDAPGQYTLDLTSRPQATYLLTLTTASGKTHTVRLMKMSDIFTR